MEQYLGVEVPNEQRKCNNKELLIDDNFKKSQHKIPICIGDIFCNIEVIDLSKTPHLLVAETTDLLNLFLLIPYLQVYYIIFSPDLKLILIDPKMLEQAFIMILPLACLV